MASTRAGSRARSRAYASASSRVRWCRAARSSGSASLVQRATRAIPASRSRDSACTHDLVQPRVDRLGQRRDRLALVAPVVGQQRRDRDRLAHHQQHGRSKQRLALVVEADGHQRDAQRAVVLRLGGQRDARRAGLQRSELRVGVRDPLGKERQGAPRRQLRPAAREAGVVPGRVAAAGAGFVRPVDGDAAERFHDQAARRIAEERALREEARRPSDRDAKDHRIEQPVGVIENENQGLPGRDSLPALDDARGIVEADQRLSQPPK